MSNALWIAKSGLDAQQTRLSVIANNLANSNTMGFKKSRPVFQDLLYQNVRQVGGFATEATELPSGFMIGTGVRTVATQTMHEQGNLVITDNSLDAAVTGRGYFQVLRPDGSIGYSRDGAFQKNSQGELVTANGMAVQPAINIPDGSISITIGSDGTVSVLEPGNSTPTQLGQLTLADFSNPTGLQSIGDNLFVESGASGPAQIGVPGTNGLGSLVQGSLESSNVNVVKEMVDMIEAQRSYEINSKAISTADEMLQYLNNNV